MEKIIEIDIESSSDLFEQYNKKKVSRDLIRYLIDVTPRFTKNDNLKVVINNGMKEDIDCAELIKKALDAELMSNEYKFVHTNRRQLLFFVLGVMALGVSALVEAEIIKEIILIGAWVLLWDMVELEIDDDISNRRKKKIIRKLLVSEFEEIKK